MGLLPFLFAMITRQFARLLCGLTDEAATERTQSLLECGSGSAPKSTKYQVSTQSCADYQCWEQPVRSVSPPTPLRPKIVVAALTAPSTAGLPSTPPKSPTCGLPLDPQVPAVTATACA